ncbi:MAG: glycoside hydrolase family 13 protein [Melioribacteraceae bacterium]|nr:glycoside hydrolase family 13 protein [Melioribacteraceae bacterium]
MKILIGVILTLVLISCSSEEEPTTVKPEDVPPWAKEAVWYQIFPERFNNADPSNDPQPKDMEGAWPYFIPEGWQVHPWTSDWYELQPWEEKTGHDFYWNAGVRRYGGDLQGVIDKLDYLSDLGINAIYFNPIFEAPSLHKYDASMYHHVDNNFGPNPEKDREIWATEEPGDPSTWKWTSADSLFLNLIQEAHKRDIKVIIDGVFNHTGTQFWAFKDIVENQEESKYKDWYTINSFDDPNTEENEFEYEGWLGVKDLPEFKENENGLVTGPSEHVHAIVKRWMDPNGDGDPSDGIDGWRLDVAEMVSHNFWRTFRKWVRDINPEAYLTGEVWWEDWQNNKMFDASPWFGDQFDAVMNYRFTRAVKHLVFQTEEDVKPQGFIDSMKTQYKEYPVDNVQVLMNLMGSHDTERHASLIVNPNNWYDHEASVKDNPDFRSSQTK